MFSRFVRSKLAVNFRQVRTMKVVAIPANDDNYQYLVVDESTKTSAIVDPVDVKSILATVKNEGANLVSALVTHHHWDHAGGTEALSNAVTNVTIYGGDAERIAAISKVLKHEDEFQVGSLKVKALRTPCHTSTHVCYFVTDDQKNERAVFTGDTLFIGGCGRFYEGTAEQMNEALNVRLAKLPNDTKVYCGHEYTVANLKFAKSVEPNNQAVAAKLSWAEKERQAGRYTVPSAIGDEKEFNPFMRVSDASVQKSLGVEDPIKAMAKLREMKNNFRG